MMNKRKEYINKTESIIVVNEGFSMKPGHRAYLPEKLAKKIGVVELKEETPEIETPETETSEKED